MAARPKMDLHMPGVGAEELAELVGRCHGTLETLRQLGVTPEVEKRLTKRYSERRVEGLIGCSRTRVRRAVQELELEPEAPAGNGRTRGYSLKQVNEMRDHLGARPGRQPAEACVRVAVQSCKGGVGKSVTSVYLAQYLAEKGYRVLLVDCDPQATATCSFGFVPDATFAARDTLAPCIRGERDTLDYAVLGTYFAGIDLIPACLALQDLDFTLYNAISRAETSAERSGFYRALDEAIGTVDGDYDVVVFDSAPSLSTMSIGILIAANALVVPTPPALADFASTAQYLYMAQRVIETVAPEKRYAFLRVLPSRVDRSKPRQLEFLEVMVDKFGKYLSRAAFFTATAIPSAASSFRTVFDESRPDRRVWAMLDRCLGELEVEIQKCWPSRHESLRDRGLMP